MDYQEFNLFKSFSITNANGAKKKFPLRDILAFKQVILAELRGAILEKRKISLKLWLRVKNIESAVRIIYITISKESRTCSRIWTFRESSLKPDCWGS